MTCRPSTELLAVIRAKVEGRRELSDYALTQWRNRGNMAMSDYHRTVISALNSVLEDLALFEEET